MLKSLFRDNPSPMFILRKRTLDIMEVNEAAIETYGYDKPSFKDKKLTDLLSSDYASEYQSAEQIDTKAVHISGDHIHETAMGNLLPVKLLIQPLNYRQHDAYLVKAMLLKQTSDYQWVIDKTEQELSQHLANSPLGYIIWDDQFHLKKISPEITEWFDVTEDELIGEKPLALVLGQLEAHDFMEVKERIDALYKGRTNNNIMEFGVQTTDEETKYLKLYNSALKDQKGNLVSVLSLVENQTELITSIKLQDLQAEIIQNATDFVCLIGPDGNIKYLNPAGRRLMGVDEEFDISSTYIKKFFTDESYHRMVSTILPKAAERGSWKEELKLRTTNGDNIPVSTVISVHKNEGGEIEYYSTISRDISTEKRIISELRTKSQKLETAMESKEVGFWQYHVDEERIELDHDWLQEKLEYDEIDLSSYETWKELIHPDDWPEASQNFWDTVTGKIDGLQDELRLKKADGSYLWILSQAKATDHDEEGNVTKLSGIHLDIHEWKRE
ncbi:PAS domain S-box protein [Fodinibius saliphilus]|uniref:PAS domain S-box protein n=1 Tax=Fodinibius saliphilus TaxID=1920650 RepID=UPI0011093B1F|nr:PAS domain S-box protein [Fodinibius saliphilus]